MLNFSSSNITSTRHGTAEKLLSLNNIQATLNLWGFIRLWVSVMVFNTTFNNISAISCRSVLLLEEIVVPGENHRPAASH